MYDVLLDACVRSGRFELGVDLLSDMEQSGTALPVDVRVKYRRMLQTFVDTSAPLSMRGGRVARSPPATRPGPKRRAAPQASPSGFERLKWWFGLPNTYYDEESKQQQQQ
jgi:pentatricopeptide repeat protein